MMMRVRTATAQAPGRLVNEDQVFVHGPLVGVIDGVSRPVGVDAGCSHGAAWYAQQLAAALQDHQDASRAAPLAELLAAAIETVSRQHDPDCDLSNPNTPAATVSLVRNDGEKLDYLILCDSPLVVDSDDGVAVIVDTRFEQAVDQIRRDTLIGDAPIDSLEHADRLREVVRRKQQLTNTSDGYWIAAAQPKAAHQALNGSLPLHGTHAVRRVALLTDGASRAVDTFHLLDWPAMLDLISAQGPEELIRLVRQAEAGDADGYHRPRYKRHDDATVALCEFTQENQ